MRLPFPRPGRESIALILIFVALIAFVPSISKCFRTAGIALETVPGVPHPLSIATTKPHRSVVEMSWREGGLQADLYDPGGLGLKPGLILVNGVVREGRRYGELENLAWALSRAGFVVMVPDLLNYREFRLVPDDVDILAEAFEFLADHRTVDPQRVGFLGFSVGGSQAFAAAAEDRIADEVRFVGMIGPYSDLARVIMAVTTESYFRDGRLISFKPESFVWSVTRNTLVATLDRAQDRAVLGALFSGPSAAPNEDVQETFDRGNLSPDGQRVYDLFVNRDPDRVAGLIASLPEGVGSALQRLSPVNAAEDIRAQVLILHENGDPYFPSWESEKLMRSLRRDNAELTLTSVVQHAELRLPPPTPGNIFGFYLREGWKLGSYIFSILSAAEA